MSQPIPEDTLAAIKDALIQGHKILAIKLHRKATGSGLAEAKTAVEELEKELRATSPDKFARKTSARGCLGVALIICGGVFALVWWLVRGRAA